ncbi:MAG: SDR family oxidoreductase [Caldilineales bacterium]|nr:SDR family oxidoreductase [Caldilineales bacterium]
MLPRPFLAVITGSTAGIGRATALALAAAGSDILLNSRRRDAKAAETLAAAAAFGVQARHLPADLSDPEQTAAFVTQAWAWQGRVDLWVNNAGADVLSRGQWRQPWEERLTRLIALDVWGAVRCCQLAGAAMQRQGHGHIINLGWDQAEQGGVSSASGQLFSLVKAGIMAYTRAIARDLAPHVRVNCVAPGWIETAWGEQVSRELHERITTGIPLARWGRPEDVANAILWLASPAAAYITGQVIRVNGGVV